VNYSYKEKEITSDILETKLSNGKFVKCYRNDKDILQVAFGLGVNESLKKRCDKEHDGLLLTTRNNVHYVFSFHSLKDDSGFTLVCTDDKDFANRYISNVIDNVFDGVYEIKKGDNIVVGES